MGQTRYLSTENRLKKLATQLIVEAPKLEAVLMYLSDIETSIRRILTTPIGSRVLEPTFGSRLYELIDKRLDKKWQMLFVRYVYEAIDMWEKRVKLNKVHPKMMGEVVKIELECLVVDKNEIVMLEILWK